MLLQHQDALVGRRGPAVHGVPAGGALLCDNTRLAAVHSALLPWHPPLQDHQGRITKPVHGSGQVQVAGNFRHGFMFLEG